MQVRLSTSLIIMILSMRSVWVAESPVNPFDGPEFERVRVRLLALRVTGAGGNLKIVSF